MTVRLRDLISCARDKRGPGKLGRPRRPLTPAVLLLRLARPVRRLGMFASGLRMALGLRRLITTLCVFTFTMMLGRGPMALGGVLVVFSRFVVRIFGHTGPP